MKEEIQSVVAFIEKHIGGIFDQEQVKKFKELLEQRLHDKYKDHWYPELPLRGSGYRAILIDYIQTDPILLQCAEDSGIENLRYFEKCLPRNVVIFCNPNRVVVKNLLSRDFHSKYVFLYVGEDGRYDEYLDSSINSSSASINNSQDDVEFSPIPVFEEIDSGKNLPIPSHPKFKPMTRSRNNSSASSNDSNTPTTTTSHQYYSYQEKWIQV